MKVWKEQRNVGRSHSRLQEEKTLTWEFDYCWTLLSNIIKRRRMIIDRRRGRSLIWRKNLQLFYNMVEKAQGWNNWRRIVLDVVVFRVLCARVTKLEGCTVWHDQNQRWRRCQQYQGTRPGGGDPCTLPTTYHISVTAPDLHPIILGISRADHFPAVEAPNTRRCWDTASARCYTSFRVHPSPPIKTEISVIANNVN